MTMKKQETIQRYCSFEQIQINLIRIHCKIRLKSGLEKNKYKKIYRIQTMKIPLMKISIHNKKDLFKSNKNISKNRW